MDAVVPRGARDVVLGWRVRVGVRVRGRVGARVGVRVRARVWPPVVPRGARDVVLGWRVRVRVRVRVTTPPQKYDLVLSKGLGSRDSLG